LVSGHFALDMKLLVPMPSMPDRLRQPHNSWKELQVHQ
jgi:hypothetical protein